MSRQNGISRRKQLLIAGAACIAGGIQVFSFLLLTESSNLPN
jgi:hypothetical protein